jgi:hypothetical protein
MPTTRREFIEGVAVVGAAAAAAGTLGVGARALGVPRCAPVACPSEPFLGELGSPHFLTTEAPDDLGGDDAYARLRERTVHFAMAPDHRDRYLLGI